MSNSKLSASVSVIIKGQDWDAKINPVVVEALRFNLCLMMGAIARYLINIGVPREQHPDELIVFVNDGESTDRTLVPNELDPKKVFIPGAKDMPYPTLEKIARMHMEGEELPSGEIFDEPGDTMQYHYYECIKAARRALGWKE